MFQSLPDSAWADGNYAEAAGQLGKMVEHRKQSQPNPGLRAHGTPRTVRPFLFSAACGGIIGLFMGFSLLSGAELIYFFTLRMWVDHSRAQKKKRKVSGRRS